jgi:hypothetical protein
MSEQPESISVDARRLGRGQRFELTATLENGTEDERRWGAVQWASKPRQSRGEFAPWWYEDGRTWHLYDGEAPEAGGGELPPPKASFATLPELKDHVRALVAGGPPAG